MYRPNRYRSRRLNRYQPWMWKSFNYLQSFYVLDRSSTLAFRLSSFSRDCSFPLTPYLSGGANRTVDLTLHQSQRAGRLFLELVYCHHTSPNLPWEARVFSRGRPPFFFVFYSGVYAKGGAVPLCGLLLLRCAQSTYYCFAHLPTFKFNDFARKWLGGSKIIFLFIFTYLL